LRSKKEVDAPASADHPQAVGKRTKESQDSEPGGPIREKIERLQSKQEMAWTNALSAAQRENDTAGFGVAG